MSILTYLSHVINEIQAEQGLLSIFNVTNITLKTKFKDKNVMEDLIFFLSDISN